MKNRYTLHDYLSVNRSNLREYRHVLLLLFWPTFGILFGLLERVYQPGYYYPVYSPLDDYIPFNELFVIPYVFWFVFLIGMHAYLFFEDVDTFRKMMKYIMITYGVTLVIYLLFPTCQLLRPTEFARDNLLTRFMAGFYVFDTNTNVCPSLHVVGSLAVVFASRNTPRFRTPGWQSFFIITGILICASTVFLKQHSIIDVFAALPLCFMAYYLSYKPRRAGSKRFLKEM